MTQMGMAEPEYDDSSELVEVPGSAAEPDLPEDFALLFGNRLPLARISEVPPTMVITLTVMRMQRRACDPTRTVPLAESFEYDFLELMMGIGRKSRLEGVEILAAKRRAEAEVDSADIFGM